MPLRDRIRAGRSPGDVLAMGPRRDLTVESLDAQAGGPGADRVVAVQAQDPLEAIPLLAALDGAVDTIVLLPDSLSKAETTRLWEAAEAQSATPPGESSSDGARSVSTIWAIPTSGTTGTPKLVAHTLESLTRTTRTDLPAFRWGLLYDYARFAGLQVTLQALLSGGVLLAPDRSQALDRQIDFLARNGCTHLSGTPTLWRNILMSPSAGDLPLRQITLGGEIADSAVLSALRGRYPEARITHIFASTEAGVGFSVNDGKAGFPKAFLDQPPNPGIRLRVQEDRLWVLNPSVGHHYIGDNQARVRDAEGWVDTGDSVLVTEDRVHFLGRASGVINVGGNKVHPEEVERALLSHPDVLAARVFARSNPFTGALVAAEIVPARPDHDVATLKAAVTAHAGSRLERHKVPVSVTVVPDLALNASGKLAR
ncbi:MAG: acyl--CoA ligase [Rhodothermales bacterium]|nr:acyl--CoA ligase [Rhodothermales bacterium]MBO6781074.1 acyl--CoA ligase [Rhodothermales bacterium]